MTTDDAIERIIEARKRRLEANSANNPGHQVGHPINQQPTNTEPEPKVQAMNLTAEMIKRRQRIKRAKKKG